MADETNATTDTTTSETTETTDATATATTADTGGADDAGGNQSLMGGAGQADTDAGAGDGEEGGADKDKAQDPDGGEDDVPEAYTFDLPEGVAVDDVLVSEATPILKELGLKQDQVAKLTPLIGKVQERIVAQQNDAHSELAASWAKEIKADKDFGGAKFNATMGNVSRALDKFGAPAGSDFRQLLDDTKLGNHPEMIRMFAKIGAALKEDSDFVRGGATSSTKLPREAVLYPNDVPKQ